MCLCVSLSNVSNPLLFFGLGRGVLIDYASWAEKNGIQYSTFSTHQIKLSDILQIAKECNITFQKGDVLLVRIGVTKEWDTIMTDAQKQAYSNNSRPEHAGVESSTDMLRWLWDTGFSAIAGDAISWEVRIHSFLHTRQHKKTSPRVSMMSNS